MWRDPDELLDQVVTRWAHTKTWVLEVSNDGSKGSGAVFDSRENNH